jgi:hypothetical protein
MMLLLTNMLQALRESITLANVNKTCSALTCTLLSLQYSVPYQQRKQSNTKFFVIYLLTSQDGITFVKRKCPFPSQQTNKQTGY